MMQPTIAHIVHSLDYGGLENGLVNLINGLPPDRYRHAVICMTRYTEFRSRITRSSTEVFAIGKRPGKDLLAYARLWRLLAKLKPAIVHTRNMGVLDCSIVASLARVPVRLHGCHGWDVDDLHGNNPRRNRIRRLCDPFVTEYVTVSEQMSKWLREDQGVRRDRIQRIYNGVDTQRFSPGPAGDDPLPWQQHPDNFVVGTVGRLEAVKDQLTLARAATALAQRDEQYARRLRLLIVGDGSQRQAIEAELAQGLPPGHWWLPGWRDDIPAIMRRLNLFVLPSLNEGISNTLLEAMACGTPAVATSVGGNPELISPGETGQLVPSASPAALADTLKTYLDNPEIAASQGRAARERVTRQFSIDAMLAAYDQLYRRLLDAR